MKNLNTYATGFLLSVVLTLTAFGAVQWHLSTGHVFPAHEFLLPALALLAAVQVLVQLIFFLHVRDEAHPRWNLAALLLAFFVVAIVIGGTLWIMGNLSHGQHELPTLLDD